GFDATFSSTFSFSSRLSTGLLGEASDITCSGPGEISVCGAAGATGSGAKSITIAAADSAGSISSRQLTIAAAMAPCVNTTTAPHITQRRRSARSSAIMALSPVPQAQPSDIRPRARDLITSPKVLPCPHAKKAGVFVALCRRIERAGQEIATHRIIAERQREVGLDGEIEWPIRPWLRVDLGMRGSMLAGLDVIRRMRSHEP